MPSLRKLDTGRWQATYRDSSGSRHSKTWPTKGQARGWAVDQEAAVRAGTHRAPSAGRVTLGEWYTRWEAARVVEPATRAKNRTHSRYVLQRWESWPLAAIDRLDVQGWVVQMQADGRGAETIAATVRLLSAVLEAAVQSNRIPTNVAHGVRLPTASKQPDRYLTRDEVEQLLERTVEPWRTVILLAAFTGLRWAEVAGLHVHRLDLLRRRLEVVEVLQRDGQVKAYPKSKAGRRTVPLPRPVVDALAAHLEHGQSGLVFTSAHGHPLHYSNFRRRVWLPAVAGVREPQPTFHDLRHTYASWLVAGGVDLRTVQVRMGHESIVTTQRYAHLAPDADERVLAVLDAGLALIDGKSPTSGGL